MNGGKKEPLVIACAANGGYVMALATMVKSVLTHLSEERSLVLFIVDGGIRREDKERLIESWSQEAPEVHWLRPDHSLFADLPLWGRITIETYFRLVLPKILPQTVKKIIWMDCDLIVERDLSEMWKIDFEDHAVMAAQDMIVPFVSSRYGIALYRELGMPPDAKYFNAGVMVINLEWWRHHDVLGKVLDYLKRYRDFIFFWDQDGLNAVLSGQWKELDPRWNQIAGVAGRTFYKPQHLEQRTYWGVVERPWIVHYAGFWKPWRFHNNSPRRLKYFRYLDETAWAGWRPKKTFKRRALGFYESTLRDFIYPFEILSVKLSRGREIWRRRLVDKTLLFRGRAIGKFPL